MGRQSGFIAMNATIASGQVDAVLIPEVLKLNSLALIYGLSPLLFTCLNIIFKNMFQEWCRFHLRLREDMECCSI